MMRLRDAMALMLLTAGCRTPVPPASVESPVVDRPTATADDPADAADEPTAKPLTLGDFPAARAAFEHLAAFQTHIGREAPALTAASFVTELEVIARLDLAMAEAWVEAFDARVMKHVSGWEHVFGGDAELVSRRAKETLMAARAARSSSPSPASLRLVSSAFGLGGYQRAELNALGALHEGRLETVYAVPVGGLAGFIPTPGGDVLIVHPVEQGYGGAIVPRQFYGVSMTFLSLPDRQASRLTLQCEEILDSVTISLPPTQGDAVVLQLRLRRSRSARFAVLECDLSGGPCTVLPRQPFHGDRPSLEVTASTAYRREPLPPGLMFPADVLRRSVHTSPDGQWLSFVSQQLVALKTDPDWSRTLWVAGMDGSAPRKIATGWGWFHAQWEADGTLSFDLDPKPSEWMAQRIAASGHENHDWEPTPHQQQRLDLMHVPLGLERNESPWGSIEYAIGHHDPVSQETWTERPTHPTRLWSSFSIPLITGSTPEYVEVPFEPEPDLEDEPEAFDPRCTAVRG